MGIIQEIVDIFKGAKDVASGTDTTIREIFNKKRYSSISSRSMEGILMYPTLVSNSISYEDMQMIIKAHERRLASFTQTALTMSPFLDLEKDKDAVGYLKQFHQNTTVKGDSIPKQLITAFESTTYSNRENGAFVAVSEFFQGETAAMKRQKGIDLTPLTYGIESGLLNSVVLPRDFRNVTSALESTKPKPNRDNKTSRENISLPNKVLMDANVKKSNELVPTSMQVRTILKDKSGSVTGQMDFVIGIKATAHSINSAEMVEQVGRGLTTSGPIFRFVQWTTGEIKFFKDYVLNMSEIKENVVSAKRSSWWGALIRRKNLSKLSRSFTLNKDILPNTSLIISKEEVEIIKSEFGVDLLDSSQADKLMRQYFLLGIIVADSSSGIAHFMYDGSTQYEIITYRALERGDDSGKNDIGDVIKLIQRVQ